MEEEYRECGFFGEELEDERDGVKIEGQVFLGKDHAQKGENAEAKKR